MDLAKAMKLEPELEKVAESGEVYRACWRPASSWRAWHRHASTHAAGIVIGRDELTQLRAAVPRPKTEAVSTQYTMDYLEECGLVKMDFLGLKTLTLIQETLRLLAGAGRCWTS